MVCDTAVDLRQLRVSNSVAEILKKNKKVLKKSFARVYHGTRNVGVKSA
jgi:hypothetical protein